ncbi:MAG TPA: hypothetical protein VH561_09015 [Micromonosporaceae bacterium]|jgi:WD40 repeat protein
MEAEARRRADIEEAKRLGEEKRRQTEAADAERLRQARSRSLRRSAVIAAVALALAGVGAYAVARHLAPPPDESILTLPIHDEVRFMAWSPDGSLLATLAGDSARVWNSTAGDALSELRGVTQADWMWWASEGPWIVVCCDDNFAATIWNIQTGETIVRAGEEDPILSGDGKYLATYRSYSVKIWDAAGGALVRTLAVRDHRAKYFIWSLDDKSFAALLQEGSGFDIGVFDIATGSEVLLGAARLPLTWSPDSVSIATRTCTAGDACQNDSTTVWNASTGYMRLTLDGGSNFFYRWSPDSTKLLIGNAGVWDVEAGHRLCALPPQVGPYPSAWSPDGIHIAGSTSSSTLTVWDADTCTEVDTFTGHKGVLDMVTWSPDGTKLATAAEDGTVRVWTAPPSGAR